MTQGNNQLKIYAIREFIELAELIMQTLIPYTACYRFFSEPYLLIMVEHLFRGWAIPINQLIDTMVELRFMT